MVKLKNNTITSYQVIKPEMVRGAKAGSKPSKPNIADDTVSSLSLAKVLYGLSEGEISGIVGDAKGISLEDTPLEDAEGNKNFENVTYDFRSGTLEQEYIKGFPDVSNEIPVSVELKSTTPWIKAINKTDLSAIRIRLAWNGLKKQDLGSGDVSGYKIEYAIDIKTGSGAYTEVLKTFINDKVSGKYERTHRIDLPESTNGWQVRVRRLTANANSELIVDKMYIESITEVMDVKLRYPNTALLGLQYDAKTFSRIAKISVRAKGKIISIPSNYDTNTGLYTGLWNGTFKQAYSDNPAWIFYDILTATRYGLGKNIDKSMVNKWSIYNLGVYCDELIDDGTGNNTKEKRYSCNVYLQTQQEAFKVLQQLAGIFKAITYWNGEQIVLDADVPQDPVYTFSRSNIIGEPDYSGTAFKDRHTVAKVAFDNPEEGYKTEYEYIRDEAGIAKYGINIVDISAIGCTSRGQAQRAGLWALKSELLETRTVSFQTGLEGFIPQVGNVIELSDGLLAGRDNGGRISKVQGKVITLDRSLTIAIDDLLIINGNDGISQKRKVINVNDKVITVATAYDNIEAGAIYAVRAKDLDTMKFRVMSIKPDDNNIFSVSAIQYEPLKYDAIDFGADVKPTDISILKPTRVSAPDNVSISATYKVVQGQTVATMVIQWSQVKEAVSYRVEWRKDNGNWIKAPVTGNVSLEVTGVYAGNYLARVVAVDAFDVSSLATTSTLTEIKGKVGAPKALANLKAVGILFGMDLSWNFLAGSEDTAYTELETATDATGANTALLGQFSYPTNKHTITGLQGGLTVYYRGRIVDKLGNVGAWSNWVKGITDNSADKLLDLLEGQITEQQLFKDLGDKIEAIDTNKTILDDLGIDLNAKVTEAKAIIDANKIDLTKAKADITKADGLIKANKDKLVLTDAEMAAAKTKVSSLESDYNSNKATVSNALTVLTNKDKSLASDITAINASVAGNTASINTNNTAMVTKTTALTNSINSLNAEYATNKANVTRDLTALATKDTAIVKDINSLNTKTDNANTEISTIKTAVADNKTSIANVRTDLTATYDNLEIGGHNLVRQSTLLSNDISEWNNSRLTFFKDSKDIGGVRIDSIAESLAFGFTFANDEAKTISLKADVEYTLSFRGQATFNSLDYVYIMRQDKPNIRLPNIVISSGGNNKRSVTFTLEEDVVNGWLLIGAIGKPVNAWFSVSGLMLQRGNKSTDWSISPYDLENAIDVNKASITTESVARASADETLTNNISTLKSAYEGNKATVTNSLSTLTNKDIALTNTLTALDSDYKGNKSSVATSLTTLTNKDIALTNSINSLTSTVGNNTTAISTEATTRSNADSALSNRITTAQSKADSAFSKITTAETTIATNTNAIAQTRTDLVAKVDNLIIGGQNILPNSDLSKGYAPWNSSSYITQLETVGLGLYTMVKNTGGNNFGVYQHYEYQTAKIYQGETYTLSWLGQGTFSNLNYIHLLSKKGGNIRLPSVDLKNGRANKYEITFVAPYTTDDLNILLAAMNQPVNAWFSFSGLMLQKGDKATEWTPSPLDAEEGIAEAKASIVSEAKVAADANRATALELKTVSSKANGNSANIQTLTNTTATNTSAIASTKATLQAQVIGGDNLIPDSTYEKGFYSWGSASVSRGQSEGYETPYIRVGCTEDNKSFGVIPNGTTHKLRLLAGKEYTLSFYGQATFETMNYIYIISPSKSNQFIGNVTMGSGMRNNKSLTFIANNDLDDGYVLVAASNQPSGAWFSFGGLQLQKGNVATTWQPSGKALSSSLEETKDVVAGVSAQWSMKLDVNGYVSGIGQYNNGTTSTFAVRADQFYIADPSSKTASTPFQVTGGKTVIKDAYIRDASIDLAKIKTASITRLDSLSANIGHFKSASTGARLEIKDSLLSVYDSNNRLRVRLGLW